MSKPKVSIVGLDGNVFSILGRVSGVLRKAGQSDMAADMTDKVFGVDSYDKALQIMMEYVDFE